MKSLHFHRGHLSFVLHQVSHKFGGAEDNGLIVGGVGVEDAGGIKETGVESICGVGQVFLGTFGIIELHQVIAEKVDPQFARGDAAHNGAWLFATIEVEAAVDQHLGVALAGEIVGIHPLQFHQFLTFAVGG